MKLATITALAAKHHRDRATVRRRLRDLAPARVERRGKVTVLLYNEQEADKLLAAVGEGEQLQHAFDRLHAARADRLELERALRRGQMVTLDQVGAELAARLSNARARAIALPTKYGPRLAEINLALTGQARQRAVEDLLHEAMVEIVAEIEVPLSFEVTQ